MAILYPHGIVGVGDLPEKFRQQAVTDQVSPSVSDAIAGAARLSTDVSHIRPLKMNAGDAGRDLLPLSGIDLKEYLSNLEKSLIGKALADSGGVVARAADRLQLGRTTLVEKMRKYDLQKAKESDVKDDLADDTETPPRTKSH